MWWVAATFRQVCTSRPQPPLASPDPLRFPLASPEPWWFAKANPGPWCGNTGSRSPPSSYPLATWAGWWPCSVLRICLKHRYAGPALQGFWPLSRPWLANIGQASPPRASPRVRSRPPGGVKRPRTLCVSPRDLGNKKHPRPTPGQPLASTSESQVTRTNSGLAKTAQKSQGALLWLISWILLLASGRGCKRVRAGR